jgi:hypothetical protein
VKPKAIDLYCGLGGWTDGLIAEGYDVVGFDIERHAYGDHRYPAQLVLQDVRTINGAQFKDASLIVASSPCQEFSYRAMPWKRAKALGPPLLGMELFAQAERIQREAIAAAGRFIPMVQENVRGAQPYVGRARWHYGSFYLWGDVPALMPITLHKAPKYILDDMRAGQRRVAGGVYDGETGRTTKNDGGSWFNVAHNTTSGKGNNPARGDGVDGLKHGGYGEVTEDGVKQGGISGDRDNGKGDRWFQDGAAASGSKSNARKAASARIAKIPFALASHIARTYYPHGERS